MSLVWMFYALLAFLLLVVVVGALTGRDNQKATPVSKSEHKADATTPKPKAPAKTKRSALRKKSK